MNNLEFYDKLREAHQAWDISTCILHFGDYFNLVAKTADFPVCVQGEDSYYTIKEKLNMFYVKPKLTLDNFEAIESDWRRERSPQLFGEYVCRYYNRDIDIDCTDASVTVFNKLKQKKIDGLLSKNTQCSTNYRPYKKITEFEHVLASVLEDVKKMLLEKNRKYGDAALNPIGIFAKGSASSSIDVRIDDKLSRIKNNQDDDIEDSVKDLIGYLVLKQVAKKMEK